MPSSAGRSRIRVAFDKRTETDDGYGNPVSGDFAEQFKSWVDLRPKGGSETVLAARLEGKNIFGAYLRSSSRTRAVTPDWRMREINSGTVYAIHTVDAVTDRQWIYLTVETGIAA